MKTRILSILLVLMMICSSAACTDKKPNANSQGTSASNQTTVTESNELQLVDEVAPAISICFDINHKWIITKSGNLGNSNTLIDILNYLTRHE